MKSNWLELIFCVKETLGSFNLWQLSVSYISQIYNVKS